MSVLAVTIVRPGQLSPADTANSRVCQKLASKLNHVEWNIRTAGALCGEFIRRCQNARRGVAGCCVRGRAASMADLVMGDFRDATQHAKGGSRQGSDSAYIELHQTRLVRQPPAGASIDPPETIDSDRTQCSGLRMEHESSSWNVHPFGVLLPNPRGLRTAPIRRRSRAERHQSGGPRADFQRRGKQAAAGRRQDRGQSVGEQRHANRREERTGASAGAGQHGRLWRAGVAKPARCAGDSGGTPAGQDLAIPKGRLRSRCHTLSGRPDPEVRNTQLRGEEQ